VRQDLLSPATGSKKDRKRVGRGNGSGHGTYSGRGCKGQKARTGNNKVRPGFEGGQLPLIKRLPRKRGFNNIFRVEYEEVNLSRLNVFEAGSEVTSDKMVEAGIIKNTRKPVKVLSRGDLKHSITVKADKFSAAAKAKIEAAGGTAVEVTNG
jgi:large subunit ribosomal protein L15